MHGTTTTQFNCTNCNALYHLIKVEAGPETVDRNLNCQACGAPLPARDGQFVLKYFLLRKPRKTQRRATAIEQMMLQVAGWFRMILKRAQFQLI
jgi:hypothetical protein